MIYRCGSSILAFTLALPAVIFFSAPSMASEANGGASAKQIAAVEEAIRLGRIATFDHKPTCDIQQEGRRAVLRYVGDTDTDLLNCLGLHINDNFSTLRITSSGGEVKASIAAANIVSLKKVRVEVVGLCASSCGYFIAGAARSLSVLPYSIVVLHASSGVVADVNSETSRARFRDFLIKSGVTDEAEIAKQTENSVREQEETGTSYLNFKAAYAIGGSWYRTDGNFSLSSPGSDKPDLRLVDPIMYEKCTGKSSKAFWWPKNQSEFDVIEKYYGKIGNLLKRQQTIGYRCS